MKILPVAVELCHVDAQTDMTKLTVALRKIAKAHKSEFAADSLIVLGYNSEHHHHRQHHRK